MRYNENVCIDLGITLEDDYIISKIEDMQNTIYIKYGNAGTFNFSLTDLFIKCPMIFKQVNGITDKDEIKKIYDTNKKKFNRLMKGSLNKVLIREDTKRDKLGKRESYFKFNKTTMTILKNGYPVKRSREFTDIEKYLMNELKLNELSNSITKQLEKMDIDVLKESIEVAKIENILDYPYVKAIYNNLIENKKADNAGDITDLNKNTNIQIEKSNNIISNNKKNYNDNHKSKLNPKLHNYMGSANFMKYTPEELEKILEQSQKDKFK